MAPGSITRMLFTGVGAGAGEWEWAAADGAGEAVVLATPAGEEMVDADEPAMTDAGDLTLLGFGGGSGT